MATERRRQLALAALVVVLIAVIARLVWPGTSAAPAATSNRTGVAPGAPARRTQAGPASPEPPGVHLDALNAERTKPGTAVRNLFRFKPKAPPPPPPAPPPPVQQPTMPAVPVGPPPPPPVAPITLKFIGVMGPDTAKIAILSDGRNPPFLGKEGAIIEGRYRILKIGVESVELAYTDGRGRQTIRLTGS